MNKIRDISILILLCFVFACEAENVVESRGKKKKIALLVYFADIVLKKFFILKLIYAFVFWVVLHKAGYFLTWFISYLKEKQHHVPHYTPHTHEYTPHYSYGGHDSYGPYRRESHRV